MKIIDKLRSTLKINKRLFLFLVVFILIGILSGTIFSLILSPSDQRLTEVYLNTFFQNINNFTSKETLLNILITTLGFSFLIYLFGISVIGFVIILFMLFGKAFVLGFTISSIINVFKTKGVIYALLYVFPHHIINLLLLLILSGMALTFSFKIIINLFKEKKIDFSNLKKYNAVLLIVLMFQTINCFYEVLFVPKILSLILPLFN